MKTLIASAAALALTTAAAAGVKVAHGRSPRAAPLSVRGRLGPDPSLIFPSPRLVPGLPVLFSVELCERTGRPRHKAGVTGK